MATSFGVSQMRVELCMGGSENRTSAREAEESPLLEAVARERLMKTKQAVQKLGECCDNL
jgi:hypothetical protein